MLSSSHASSGKQIANLKKFSFNDFLTSFSLVNFLGMQHHHIMRLYSNSKNSEKKKNDSFQNHFEIVSNFF